MKNVVVVKFFTDRSRPEMRMSNCLVFHNHNVANVSKSIDRPRLSPTCKKTDGKAMHNNAYNLNR